MSTRVQKKLNSGFNTKSEPGEILAGKDLSGKVVIVTGGYSGIGLETTRALGWTDADGNLSEQVAAMFKSTTQGCSTTLWAATSDDLADTGGLYCEDCDVSNLATEDSPRFFDVAPWAVSEEGASKLWDLTEKMLAE